MYLEIRHSYHCLICAEPAEYLCDDCRSSFCEKHWHRDVPRFRPRPSEKFCSACLPRHRCVGVKVAHESAARLVEGTEDCPDCHAQVLKEEDLIARRRLLHIAIAAGNLAALLLLLSCGSDSIPPPPPLAPPDPPVIVTAPPIDTVTATPLPTSICIPQSVSVSAASCADHAADPNSTWKPGDPCNQPITHSALLKTATDCSVSVEGEN